MEVIIESDKGRFWSYSFFILFLIIQLIFLLVVLMFSADLLERPVSPEMVIFYITQDTQRHPLLLELKSGVLLITNYHSLLSLSLCFFVPFKLEVLFTLYVECWNCFSFCCFMHLKGCILESWSPRCIFAKKKKKSLFKWPLFFPRFDKYCEYSNDIIPLLIRDVAE